MVLDRTFTDRQPVELDLGALESALRGRLIRPADLDFDAARQVHNAAIDRRPLAIVQPADTADVALVVDVARETGLDLAVRGGGHSFAGFGSVEGGIVLDLSSLRGLHIDPERRMAWAQPGLTAGEYTRAAAEHGLATPFGDVASVGIAGLTLGGGIGWLVRKYGLTIDSLLSAEVVTADGSVVVASPDENPDLFWAIRGGGGNFGVVTRFVFRLHPVGTVLAGALFMPATREVLSALVPTAKAAPEELTTISFLMAAPPAPFIPVEEQGKPTLAIMLVWAGDPEAGQAALAPFRALATPIADVVMPMPYPGIYEFTQAAEARSAEMVRSMFLDELDDEAVDILLDRTAKLASSGAMTQIRIISGAMARVPGESTAFGHRDREVMLNLITLLTGDEHADAGLVEATLAQFEALRPKGMGVYSNFLELEGDDRIREAYPGGTLERLAEAKRRYDPTNVFRLNQNIRPDGPRPLPRP
jgi:FAD/FMN-containing dehydrogenase